MDIEKVKMITAKAKKWARANGFHSDEEDMAQYVLLRLSQNRKANVGHICIDYVRSVYGRTGKLAHKKQKSIVNERRFYVDLETIETYGLEVAYDMNLEPLDFAKLQDYLESKERAILTLRFKWGMTETEIADCFGITEGRVSQKLSQIREKLKDFVSEDIA